VNVHPRLKKEKGAPMQEQIKLNQGSTGRTVIFREKKGGVAGWFTPLHLEERNGSENWQDES